MAATRKATAKKAAPRKKATDGGADEVANNVQAAADAQAQAAAATRAAAPKAARADRKLDASALEVAENLGVDRGYVGTKPEPAPPITDANTPITQHTFTKEASDG